MEIGRGVILAFILTAGAMLLAAYVAGVLRAPRPTDLWGGVTPAMQKAIVPLMFLAAAGFLAYFWVLLFRADPEVLAQMRWPWGASDGNGAARVFAAVVVLIIPSMLWLEATLLHLRSPQPWTPALVVVVLALAAAGSLMLILLATSAVQDGVPDSGWMLAGALALGVQTIINDFVIWTLRFPW